MHLWRNGSRTLASFRGCRRGVAEFDDKGGAGTARLSLAVVHVS